MAVLRRFYFDKSWKWYRRLACRSNYLEQLVQEKTDNSYGGSYVGNFDSRYIRATLYHCIEPWVSGDGICLRFDNFGSCSAMRENYKE